MRLREVVYGVGAIRTALSIKRDARTGSRCQAWVCPCVEAHDTRGGKRVVGLIARENVRSFSLLGGVVGATILAIPALAQQPSIEDLMRKIDALQRRVDELESRQPATKPPVAQPHRNGAAPVAAPRPAPAASGANPTELVNAPVLIENCMTVSFA